MCVPLIKQPCIYLHRKGENFHKLVKRRFSQRKLSWIAHFDCAKGRHAPKLRRENFREFVKFAKVFSLKSFPLYSTEVKDKQTASRNMQTSLALLIALVKRRGLSGNRKGSLSITKMDFFGLIHVWENG